MSTTFLRFPGYRDKAVTLSYDDGLVFDRPLIEIMSEYGLKGTFNLNSGNYERKSISHIKEEELTDLYLGSGNEPAVHGKNHIPLAEVDSAVATEDIINDRLALEKIFGVIIRGMAYANGSYDERTSGILRNCGIVYSRTTNATGSFNLPSDWLRLDPTCHHDDPRLMEFAKTFIETPPSDYYLANTPKMFYLWGHSYEFNNKNSWSVIKNFAKYIGGRDDVWYATNGEIYSYVKAYESLIFSADGRTVYNPSSTDIYLNYFNTHYTAYAGKVSVLK